MTQPDLVLKATRDGVTTLTMNNPDRLNGWTQAMLASLGAALQEAADDPDTNVVILTGAGDYYCAGVNLSAVAGLTHPRTLREMIVTHNKALFDSFILFPKPILIAANGPGIGACVTAATLCDGIIASERATFSTPFARLGVPPEGCSSVVFPKLLGEANAARMLGEAAWKPTAAEAREAGLVGWVVGHDDLMDEAHRIATEWIAAGRVRTYPAGLTREDLQRVNGEESERVADAFLDRPFLRGQYEFLKKKGKRGPAMTFYALWLTRPLWARLL